MVARHSDFSFGRKAHQDRLAGDEEEQPVFVPIGDVPGQQTEDCEEEGGGATIATGV